MIQGFGLQVHLCLWPFKKSQPGQLGLNPDRCRGPLLARRSVNRPSRCASGRSLEQAARGEVHYKRTEARWKLGKALAVAPRNTHAGPGRGKKGKTVGKPHSFLKLLRAIGLGNKEATEAQRIGALPSKELQKVLDKAHPCVCHEPASC